MIRKPNFKLNWKYALGELVLIFLGISLAIGFQNWNEERKKMTLEKELLGQIYADISNNTEDVNADFILIEQGVKSHFRLIDAFKNDESYSPEFVFDFYFLTIDEYTYPIQINYDRLKNIGLEIISNDSLGIMIENLYEFGYPRIDKQTSFHPDISEHFSNFYAKNFRPNEDMDLKFEIPFPDGTVTKFPDESIVSWRKELETAGYVPLDYEQLKKSNEFRMLMDQASEFRIYKFRQYQRIIALSQSIMDIIDQTIDTSTLK